MNWITSIHLYLHFPNAAQTKIAKRELENFIYEKKHLAHSLQVESQYDNTVTIHENNNEIFDMENIVSEIQNFCKHKFQQNLQGRWQGEGKNGSQYIHEMIDGRIESENGDWILEYPVAVIRQIKAIAQIIAKRN